jgi:hypothetical protein
MLNLGEDRLLHDVLRGEHLVVETKAPSEASHGGSGVLPPQEDTIGPMVNLN